MTFEEKFGLVMSKENYNSPKKIIVQLKHLGVLFQELSVKGSQCFDVVNRLLLIPPLSNIGTNAISHLCIVARKNPTPILPVKLDSSWCGVNVISNGLNAVGVNFLSIHCAFAVKPLICS